VVAPGTVVGIVPWLITRWWMQPAWLGTEATRIAGAVLLAAGLAVAVESFARFALKGLGTPAPLYPPHHLVVSGHYRFVRNPMYVALLAAIVGQALLFASGALIIYAALVWLCCHAFVRLHEEPTLRRTFGREYEEFCAHVPRWVPRIRPWMPDHDRTS
jgi:protein-S-isoprenylcysteine O-methyltransferase Ste14